MALLILCGFASVVLFPSLIRMVMWYYDKKIEKERRARNEKNAVGMRPG